MALICSRRSELPPFLVMDVMAKADAMAGHQGGIMRLDIGQPAASPPLPVSQAIADSLSQHDSHAYTLAAGRAELREGIANHYRRWYDVAVDPHQVLVTVGASMAYPMALLTCFDIGARVAMAMPAYVTYRNMMISFGIECVNIPARAAQNWRPQIKDLEAMMPLDGLVIASPNNPTGVVLSKNELTEIAAWCHKNGVRLISDEIYHGITFNEAAHTAIDLSPSAIVINSFSKYFCMTGYRIGWMVVPADMVDAFERLAQNCVISVPTLSQIAATEAINNAKIWNELDQHVKRYQMNRDILLNELPEKFLGDGAPIDGAFYLYADTSAISHDSMELAERLLTEIGVTSTPGVDFDSDEGHLALRFSFAGATEDIREAAIRIKKWMRENS